MFYEDVLRVANKIIEDADTSIKGNYADMDDNEKLIFLLYQFYHLGYEDGKADKDIGTYSYKHEH